LFQHVPELSWVRLQHVRQFKLQLRALLPASIFILLIRCPHYWMLLPMFTFQLSVLLSSYFTLFFEPGGQVFCPSVRIPLDLSTDRLYDSRVLCFCYKKLLHFASPQLIIVVVFGNNVIKRLCEPGAITMCLPFPDAVHVLPRIVPPYPLMSLLCSCRWIYPFT
jgi:hypothetical protein